MLKKTNTETNLKKNHLFFYLFLLTFFFMLFEVSFFLFTSTLYLGDFTFIIDRLRIPLAIVPSVLYFLTAQCVIHMMYAGSIGLLAYTIGNFFNYSSRKIENIGITFWFLGLIWILLANQHFYPNSKFSSLTRFFFHSHVSMALFVLASGILIFLIVLSLYAGLTLLIRRFNIKKVLLGLCCVTCLSSVVLFQTRSHNHDVATEQTPNIIFIGIDSLRPDFLGFFGNRQETPHLDTFLTQATVFSDALTPLARTYPSWVSVLTGQYPRTSGVRFNLANTSLKKTEDALPVLLQQHGYETIFATDETRFSNIDQRFGFDHVVTTPIGLSDFFLGTINDFPLSNLIVNTGFGQYLFPYSYANRPVAVTYDPDRFLARMKHALNAPRNKPVFLAVHFCLTHYPYYWGSYIANDTPLANYQAAVHRVDQQFSDFLHILKTNHLLDHAIVVLLSDHGEAIELPGDRITESDLFIPAPGHPLGAIPHFYPPAVDTEKVNESAGHGTDVLGLPQYHVVLAVHTYGLNHQAIPQLLNNSVSLLDIKPTLLEWLHFNHSGDPLDGRSLYKLVQGKTEKASELSDFFTESDFSPQSVRSVHPETRSVLFEGIDLFQLNPYSLRLTVKPSAAQLILSSKQYADFYHGWVLALYPQNTKRMMPILVNLKTGQWTNDLRIPFARQAPVQHMLRAMRHFYGSDIISIENCS